MSPKDWITPILHATFEEFHRGTTRLTVYAHDEHFWIETTTPRPADPYYLLFIAESTLQDSSSRAVLALLHAQLLYRIHAGIIARKPETPPEENQS